MKRAIAFLLALLLASPAWGQAQQTFPPNTVFGRMGIGPGPGQAIPFATLTSQLFGAIPSGSLIGNTGGSTGIPTALPIIPWAAQVHQNGGGTNFGHTLLWADQNTALVADLFNLTSGDQSILQSFTIAGTPAAGNTVTITFTLATVVYPVVYTVQAGDTTATIATALAACVAGGSTHCTGGAAFVAALLAFHGADGIGYRPAAGANGSSIVMDFPWAASGNSIAVSATGGGATITGGTGTNLDNGPIFSVGRNVPGRTPVAGDQPFNFQMGCQSGANTGIDTSCGLFGMNYLGTASSGHVYATQFFAGAANSNQGPVAWYVGPEGVYTADTAGDGNGCGGFSVDTFSANDPGYGNISACGNVYWGGGNGEASWNSTDGAVLQGLGASTNDMTAKTANGSVVWDFGHNSTQLNVVTLALTNPLGAPFGGSGIVSPAAHSILQSEGSSVFNLLTASVAGHILIDQGAGLDWASGAMSGDATLASNGALTIGTRSTWTPAVTASSTAGTPAYTTHIGSYEQIGRQVTVRFNIVLSGWTGTPSGNVTITGLPVTSANTAGDLGVCTLSNWTVSSSSGVIAGTIAPNTSVITLSTMSSTTTANLTATNTGTTPTLIGQCNYHT